MLEGEYEGTGLSKLAKSGCVKGEPPFFARVRGFRIPLLINAFASTHRLEAAWGMSADALAERANRLSKELTQLTYTDPKLYETLTGLDELPLCRFHEGDTAGSINLGCVITEHGGTYRGGIYRIEPIDGRTAVIHCAQGSGLRRSIEEGNGDIPVTVAVGCSPFLVFTCACTFPYEYDSLRLASALGDAKYIRTSGFPVPADTRVIIHGTVGRKEMKGGRFFNHTGKHTEPKDYPLMNIKSVQIMKGGFLQTMITDIPPTENVYLGQAAARVHFYRFLETYSAVRDIRHPEVGVYGRLCFVSADGINDVLLKRLKNDHFYGRFSKIFVFDDDTDITDIENVFWRIGHSQRFGRNIDGKIFIV
ncbi:UbiD family decarboxylase [Seleniivibrio woodruffii]|uniref:UbiD family decarboxylase n=1 Tax=Seleniivibrio woodruffii TaxID=1078050 RepID=A0A4R1KBQ7_9BACT|nr:UbiD family decarboxylase [Seleniivibrio woodruffii]TCK62008.1 UbiD family decarboxylase [Seleniivibrio woodruffii]TVZ34875.1 UbiD family decarboxylase [Seleniivibrio woodruffii]